MTSPKVRVGLRIPYEQNTKLVLIASKIGVSKNAIILQALRDFLEKCENKVYEERTDENERDCT